MSNETLQRNGREKPHHSPCFVVIECHSFRVLWDEEQAWKKERTEFTALA